MVASRPRSSGTHSSRKSRLEATSAIGDVSGFPLSLNILRTGSSRYGVAASP